VHVPDIKARENYDKSPRFAPANGSTKTLIYINNMVVNYYGMFVIRINPGGNFYVQLTENKIYCYE